MPSLLPLHTISAPTPTHTRPCFFAAFDANLESSLSTSPIRLSEKHHLCFGWSHAYVLANNFRLSDTPGTIVATGVIVTKFSQSSAILKVIEPQVEPERCTRGRPKEQFLRCLLLIKIIEIEHLCFPFMREPKKRSKLFT